jgi:hypothetical protein
MELSAPRPLNEPSDIIDMRALLDLTARRLPEGAIYMYIYIYMCVWMCICICVCTRVCVYAYAHLYIYKCEQVTCACIFTHILHDMLVL